MTTTKLSKVIEQTEDSIKRAIRRLKNSQHKDGGWGLDVEKCDFWGTAYAVKCLLVVNDLRLMSRWKADVDFLTMITKGINWIENNPNHWSVEHIPLHGGTSVYNISLAEDCFKGLVNDLRPEISSKCRGRLIQSQNNDGGWDATIWGSEVRTPTRVWSEVGATSQVLQMVRRYWPYRYYLRDRDPLIIRGVHWIIDNQNEDGSWNDGSCRPNVKGVDGISSTNKTCDALKSLSIGFLYIAPDSQPRNLSERIDKAVEWILSQNKCLLDKDAGITCWGQTRTENITLILETLLKLSSTYDTLISIHYRSVEYMFYLEDALIPLITANAHRLMENQYKKDGDVEDGDWIYGHTARIALSLD